VKIIAVIEDNPDNRLLLRAILGERYALQEYDSGPAALRELDRASPDLVLLDISLPGMDGIEVLRRIRAHDDLRCLPVVALTAHALAGDRERFLGAGFDDYVTKPIVDERGLIAVIARCLAPPASVPRLPASEPSPRV
jgi:CheY-like chemotaxis protein